MKADSVVEMPLMPHAFIYDKHNFPCPQAGYLAHDSYTHYQSLQYNNHCYL
jgi:hypothetical protein